MKKYITLPSVLVAVYLALIFGSLFIIAGCQGPEERSQVSPKYATPLIVATPSTPATQTTLLAITPVPQRAGDIAAAQLRPGDYAPTPDKKEVEKKSDDMKPRG